MTQPQDEIQIQLDELDTRLDRLRASYEQYFVGIEKIEPHVQRKDVERRVHALRKSQLRNTATRFRFQALIQKYTTYITYWQRVCRQIEEGTFKRDLARVQRYGSRPVPRPSAPDAIETLGADDLESLDDDTPTVPPPALDALDEPDRSPQRASRSVPPAKSAASAPPVANPAPTATSTPAPPVAARAPVTPSSAPIEAPWRAPATPRASVAPDASDSAARARDRMIEEIPGLGSVPPPPMAPAAPAATKPAAVPVPPVAPAPSAPRRAGISPFGGALPHTARPAGPPPRKRSSGSMRAVKPPAAPIPAPGEPAPAPAKPVKK